MPLTTYNKPGAERFFAFTAKLGDKYWKGFTWDTLIKSNADYINNTQGAESAAWRLLAFLIGAPLGAVSGVFLGLKFALSQASDSPSRSRYSNDHDLIGFGICMLVEGQSTSRPPAINPDFELSPPFEDDKPTLDWSPTTPPAYTP